MKRELVWETFDVPGFRATHLTLGAFGTAMVAGDRDGTGTVVVPTPTDGPPVIVPLSGGPLVAFTSNGSGFLAVTADVRHYGDPSLGESSYVRSDPLPRNSAGERPIGSWATTGDRDMRLVLAYLCADGVELSVLGDQLQNELTPTPNRLLLHGDLDQVLVTSHEGYVLVAGPVGDGPPAQDTQVWLCPDPDFGGEPWERLVLDPVPDAITATEDGPVWYWFAGRVGLQAMAWDQSGQAIDVPPVPLDPGHAFACIAAAPIGDSGLVLAAQTPTGPEVYWRLDGRSVHARLPKGRLGAALRTARHEKLPERLYVIVDGVVQWVDWSRLESARE